MVLREGHPLNSECWEGDLEVEFVTTFLGGLPGLSYRWPRVPQAGAPGSDRLEESYSDQFLTSLQP